MDTTKNFRAVSYSHFEPGLFKQFCKQHIIKNKHALHFAIIEKSDFFMQTLALKRGAEASFEPSARGIAPSTIGELFPLIVYGHQR